MPLRRSPRHGTSESETPMKDGHRAILSPLGDATVNLPPMKPMPASLSKQIKSLTLASAGGQLALASAGGHGQPAARTPQIFHRRANLGYAPHTLDRPPQGLALQRILEKRQVSMTAPRPVRRSFELTEGPSCFSPLESTSDSSTPASRLVKLPSSTSIEAQSRVLVLEGKLQEAARKSERFRLENAKLRQAAMQQNARKVECASQTDGHPAFGSLICDLGYKRLYLASARSLTSSVPIWAAQRPCSESRIDEIVRAHRSKPELIGSILCFEFVGIPVHAPPSVACPQPRGIFDGQHRVLAAARLLASDHFEIEGDSPSKDSAMVDDFSLLVEVYPVCSAMQVKQLYLAVNKAESVQEIDLPDAIAPARKKFIDQTVETLARRRPQMFKPSSRCRPPHIHKDTLRNKLFIHAATERIESAAELTEMILELNSRLGLLSKKHWPPRVHKAIDKAKANHCFLGLDEFNWLDHLNFHLLFVE